MASAFWSDIGIGANSPQHMNIIVKNPEPSNMYLKIIIDGVSSKTLQLMVELLHITILLKTSFSAFFSFSAFVSCKDLSGDARSEPKVHSEKH